MNEPQHLFDSLVTAVVVLTPDFYVEKMNSAAESLLHISALNARGKPLSDIILHSEKIYPRLEDARDNAQSFTERDFDLYLPENITETVDITVSFLERGAHQPPTLLVELHGLNRLKRINKDGASITRQETARQLIRGLAHEVKNPLGGIRGAAQLLERELTADNLREYTTIIISEADRLKTLVDRLLGPQKLMSLANINIFEALERVVQLIEAERPNTIQWIRDYDPSLPDLEADESQLIQALLNILSNASQALSEADDPKITLRCRVIRQFTIGSTRHRMVLQVDIADNGPGIDPELEERIFFPMISGRASGTGLGLAITQNIISQHQGSIQVSTRPGSTCFSIYLPFTQPVKSKREPTR